MPQNPDGNNGETAIWEILYDDGQGGGNIDISDNPATFSVGTKNDRSITLNISNAGTFTANWIISNNCGDAAQQFIIEKYNTVSDANAGDDQFVCADNTLMAATPVQANETGTWSKVSGAGNIPFAERNNPNASVNSLVQGGISEFVWTVSNAAGDCGTTQDTVEITYSEPISGPISAGVDQQVCNNNTLLNGSEPDFDRGETGLWTVVSEPQPGATIFTDSTLFNTFVTLNESGDYQLQWTISNACGSEASAVNITRFANDINTTNPADAGDTVTICAASYEMQANAPVQGIGEWQYVSGPGNIVIGQENNPNATLENLTEANPTTYNWVLRPGTCAESIDQVTITKSGDISAAEVGPDQEICADSTQLQVTNGGATQEGETGRWSVTQQPGGSPAVVFTPDVESLNPTVSNLVFGTYEFTWTISNGVCNDATATVEVIYYQTPENAVADQSGRDSLFACADEAFIALDAAAAILPGAIGEWFSEDGLVFDDINDEAASIIGPIGEGNYTLHWTLTNGVCASDPDSVILTVLPALTNPLAGIDKEICTDTVALAANVPDTLAGETGTWTAASTNGVAGITFNPDQNSPEVTAGGMTFGSYAYIWTISNGRCNAKIDTVIVDYLETPAKGNGGDDVEICEIDASPQLNGTAVNPPFVGQWTSLSGLLRFTDDEAGTTDNVNNPIAFVQDWGIGRDTLIWTVTNGSCSVIGDSVAFEVFAEPDLADADIDNNTVTDICLNESIILNANDPTVGNGMWTSDDPLNTNFSDASAFDSEVTFDLDGTYRLTWTISNGACTPTSDFIDITVNPLPVIAFAGENDTICTDTYQVTGSDPDGNPAAWRQADEDTDRVTITSTGPTTADITNIGYGDHHLIWEITTGACGVIRDTVLIRRSVDPVVDAGPDQNLCFDETNMAAVDPGVGMGSWSKDNAFDDGIIADVNNPTTFLSDLAVGTTKFIWTVQNEACGPFTDEVDIIVNEFPEPDALIGSEDNFVELCEEFTLDLNAAQPDPPTLIALWRVLAPSTNTVDFGGNEDQYDATVTGLGYGTTVLGWSLDNGECLVEDTLTIQVYHAPTVAEINEDNVTTCDTTYQFNADPPLHGVGTWTRVFGPAGALIESPNKASTKINNLLPGNHQFRWTVSNGTCPNSTDNVDVLVLEVPVSDAGEDQELCQSSGTSTLLDGNIPPGTLVGTWNVLFGTGILADENDPKSSVANLSEGANLLTWTVDNGTCSTVDTINITLFNDPSIATVGVDIETCLDSVQLFAGNVTSGEGSWSLLSGQGIISNPKSKTPIVSDLGLGVNEFQWTVTSGPCTPSTAIQTITRFATPELANAGLDQEICSDTTQLLGNPSTAGTGTWTLVTGTGVFDDANDPTTIVRGLSDGLNRFAWTISTVKCGFTTDTVAINVQPRTSLVQTGANQEICIDSTSITALPVSQGAGHWESDSTSASILEPNNDTSAVINLRFGNNYFIWVVENGVCPIARDTLIVNRLVPPIQANAGLDQSICTDSTIMEGNNDPTADGNWSVVPGEGQGTFENPSLFNTAVTNIPDGLHRYVWTLSKGSCPSTTDTVSVFVNERSSPAIAGIDRELCLDSVQLIAAPVTVGVGHWEKIGTTATIQSPNNDTTMVYNLAFGENQFIWVVENAPCTPLTDTVIITRSQPVEMANAGEDQEICVENTIMDADEVFIGVGEWEVLQGGAVLTDVNDPKTSVSNLSRLVDNIFMWKVSNESCSPSRDTVTIRVNQFPTTADAGTDQVICDTDFTLSGNNPVIGQGYWEVISGGGSFDDSTLANATISGLAPGDNVLQWNIHNGACDTSSAQVIIHRDENPSDPIVQDDFNVCDTVAEISAMSPTIGTGVWVTFSPGRTIEDNTANVTNVGKLEFGDNRFAWIVRNGVCPLKSAILNVTRNRPPEEPEAGIDIEVCGDATTLNATPFTYGNGIWTHKSGTAIFDNDTSPQAQVSNLNIGENTLYWQAVNGACIGNTDSVKVTALPLPQISLDDDQELCEITDVNISASALQAEETGTWRVIAGAGVVTDLNNPTTSVSDLSIGVNQIEWYVENSIGCNDADTLTITVYEQASNPVIAAIEDVCEDTLVGLVATAPLVGTGKWSSITPGLSIANDTLVVTTASLSNYGLQEITYTVTNGVCPAKDTTIVFNRDQTPSDPEVMTNDTICEDELIISATNPDVGSGVWQVQQGEAILSDSLDNQTLASNLSEGENVFTWEVSNGVCEAKSANLAIIKLPALSIPQIDELADICTDVFDISANEPGIGERGYWSIANGANVLIDDTTNNQTTVSGNAPETIVLEWTITNDKCSLTDQITVEFYGNVPQADAGEAQGICEPSTILAAIEPAKGIGTWTVIDGQGLIDDDNDPGTQISALDTGITRMKWTVSLGSCPETSDTLLITRGVGPEIILSPIFETQPGVAVLLDAVVNNAITTQWTPPNGITDPSQARTSAIVFDNTSYQLIATGPDGCVSSASTTIEVSPLDPDEIVQINLFSPNGDGINDYWTINEQAMAEGCEVLIYDRYGVLVFSAKNYDNQWDGTKEGELLPEGTYYYTITCGDKAPETGAITLLR